MLFLCDTAVSLLYQIHKRVNKNPNSLNTILSIPTYIQMLKNYYHFGLQSSTQKFQLMQLMKKSTGKVLISNGMVNQENVQSKKRTMYKVTVKATHSLQINLWRFYRA